MVPKLIKQLMDLKIGGTGWIRARLTEYGYEPVVYSLSEHPSADMKYKRPGPNTAAQVRSAAGVMVRGDTMIVKKLGNDQFSILNSTVPV